MVGDPLAVRSVRIDVYRMVGANGKTLATAITAIQINFRACPASGLQMKADCIGVAGVAAGTAYDAIYRETTAIVDTGLEIPGQGGGWMAG